MGKEVSETSGYYSATGEYIEAPKRQLFRLQIPYMLRFGLIWTLFFIVVGIAIQSMQAEPARFIFAEFFTSNYVLWFRSFGTFTDASIYPAIPDVFYAIMSHWYYFFYTGGLLSVLWGFISMLIHWEVVFRKPAKKKEEELVQEPLREKPKEQPKPAPQPILEEKPASFFKPRSQITQGDLYEWLQEGYLFLAEKNLSEAELIYKQIQRAYDASRDPDRIMYRKIIDFYDEILREKQPLRKVRDEWEG